MRFRPLCVDYLAEALQIKEVQRQAEGIKRPVIWINDETSSGDAQQSDGHHKDGLESPSTHSTLSNTTIAGQEHHRKRLCHHSSTSDIVQEEATTLLVTNAGQLVFSLTYKDQEPQSHQQFHSSIQVEKKQDGDMVVFQPPKAYTQWMGPSSPLLQLGSDVNASETVMLPFENLAWLGVDGHEFNDDDDILPSSPQQKRMEARNQFQYSLTFSPWLLKLISDLQRRANRKRLTEKPCIPGPKIFVFFPFQHFLDSLSASMLQDAIYRLAFLHCQINVLRRLDAVVRRYDQLVCTRKSLGEEDPKVREAFFLRYFGPSISTNNATLSKNGQYQDWCYQSQSVESDSDASTVDHKARGYEEDSDDYHNMPDEICSSVTNQGGDDSYNNPSISNQVRGDSQMPEITTNVPTNMKYSSSRSWKQIEKWNQPSWSQDLATAPKLDHYCSIHADRESNQLPTEVDCSEGREQNKETSLSCLRDVSTKSSPAKPKHQNPPCHPRYSNGIQDNSSNGLKWGKKQPLTQSNNNAIIAYFWDKTTKQGHQEASQSNVFHNQNDSSRKGIELGKSWNGHSYQENGMPTLDGKECFESGIYGSELFEARHCADKDDDDDTHLTEQANNKAVPDQSSPVKTKEMTLLERFGLSGFDLPEKLHYDNQQLSLSLSQDSHQDLQDNYDKEQRLLKSKRSTEQYIDEDVLQPELKKEKPPSSPKYPPPMLFQEEESSQIFFDFAPDNGYSEQEEIDSHCNDRQFVKKVQQDKNQNLSSERKRKKKKDKKSKKKSKKIKKETDEDHDLEIPRKIDFLELSPLKPASQPSQKTVKNRHNLNKSGPSIFDCRRLTQTPDVDFNHRRVEDSSRAQQQDAFVEDFAHFHPQYPLHPPDMEMMNKPSDSPALCLLCSERFLETYGTVVGDLARGDLFGTQSRPIQFLDTSLVADAGVDIELPGDGAILVLATSEFQLKGTMHPMSRLLGMVTCCKYKWLEVVMVLDSPMDNFSSHMVCRLQNAVIQNEGLPRTSTCFKTATQGSLSSTISSSVLSVNTTESVSQGTEHWLSHEGTRSRINFLLDLVPNLSVTEAVLWLEADVKAERFQLSMEEKIANWFRRVLGDSNPENSGIGPMQDNKPVAFNPNVAYQLQLLMKAVFVFDYQQLPLSH